MQPSNIVDLKYMLIKEFGSLTRASLFLNVDETTVSQWVCGINVPKKDSTILKYSSRLNIDFIVLKKIFRNAKTDIAAHLKSKIAESRKLISKKYITHEEIKDFLLGLHFGARSNARKKFKGLIELEKMLRKDFNKRVLKEINKYEKIRFSNIDEFEKYLIKKYGTMGNIANILGKHISTIYSLFNGNVDYPIKKSVVLRYASCLKIHPSSLENIFTSARLDRAKKSNNLIKDSVEIIMLVKSNTPKIEIDNCRQVEDDSKLNISPEIMVIKQ